MPVKISVTIITFNEEKNIGRCLSSVQDIADEIIVVDSLSTDKTVEICKSYGAKVIKHEFQGYGQQKGLSTREASFDFILSVDADEELSDELIKSIKQLKGDEPKCHGYTFNRLNLYCGKPIRHCGWYPDKKLRLFDRRFTRWSEHPVHESVNTHNELNIAHIGGNLLHYTCQTINEHQVKERKYATMNAEKLIRSGKTIFIFTPSFKFFFRFIKTYFFKLGFLDGYYGFVISKTLAHSSYLKYSIARKEIKRQKML